MIRYEAGELVKKGFYLNRSTAEFVQVSTPWGNLPWDASGQFIRVPGLLVALAAPVIGGLFVMFLPFIAFAMVLSLAAKQVGKGTQWAGQQVLGIMIPQWRPGESYLARPGARGRKRGKKTPEGEKKENGGPKMEKLAREIERRRQKPEE